VPAPPVKILKLPPSVLTTVKKIRFAVHAAQEQSFSRTVTCFAFFAKTGKSLIVVTGGNPVMNSLLL
jgi:hypothetical protein